MKRRYAATVKTSKYTACAITIIELLVTIAIIGMLMGILTPILRSVRKRAKETNQRAQLHSISLGLEMFRRDDGEYPPSDDPGLLTNKSYCGAQKLAEALLGRDLRGFHPASGFRLADKALYDANLPHNLTDRRRLYIDKDCANVQRLDEVYDSNNPDFSRFVEPNYVLCDVFGRITNLTTNKVSGMPILYYAANTSNNAHDVSDPDNPRNIYNYEDNEALLKLGKPPRGVPEDHQLIYDVNGPNPGKFYGYTRNEDIPYSAPFRASSYILITAGMDGIYGTRDDICNFNK